MSGNIDLNHPANWKYTSQTDNGLQLVVSPENSACTITWIWRLNLEAGQSFQFEQDKLETNAIVFEGKIELEFQRKTYKLIECDSFYLPASETVIIKAIEKSCIFIGGAEYEDVGKFFVRKFDPTLPVGEIFQIHGKPPYERKVFMTINQEVPGSKLICGITWGEEGKWTSWPPHQHSKDLEEVYCYFDIPKPKSAFHFVSRKPGEFEFVHPVSTGDCVIVPEGYHPTCGMPGISSKYFWVMAAFSQKSRRYDLATNDPNFG